MKTLSAQLEAHLQGETTTLVTCADIIQTKYQPRIIGITQANPAVVTTRWAHGYTTGDAVKIVKVRGMVEVNRTVYQITKVDDFSFSIPVNATGFGVYTAKGLAQRVIGFTAHYKDLTINGITYKASLGYAPKGMQQRSNLAEDGMDVQGPVTIAAKNEVEGLLIDGIVDEDLIAGKFDNAEMNFFIVNYEDLDQGRLNMPVSGNLGETTLSRGVYRAELAGLTAKLQETLNEVYSGNCRADLGDDLDGSEPEHDRMQGFGCKIRLDPPLWTAATAYSLRVVGDGGSGSIVKSSDSATWGVSFKAIQSGTSDAVEPVWDYTVGNTTVDGTVVWEAFESLTKTGFVTTAIDQRHFIDDARAEAPRAGLGDTATLFAITAVNQGAKKFTIAGNFAENFPILNRFSIVGSTGNDGDYTIVSSTDVTTNTEIVVSETINNSTADGSIIGRLPSIVGFFSFGVVTFLTGANIGISREVRTFATQTADGTTFTGPGYFELFEAFPFLINQGDEYEATAGCDKSLVMCVEFFDNVHNRRAEDNIPGTDKVLLYPDAK